MASNTFGQCLTITTWGESHGKAMGVVVDGVPAGIELNEGDIQTALKKRAPGQNVFTSPRVEKDQAEIYSGVFEGKTTGSPVSIIIPNTDSDSSKYEPIKNLLRPGHANYTYLEKYGCFDYRGGGRASARETVCRVAASVIAKKILAKNGVRVLSFIQAIAGIVCEIENDVEILKKKIEMSEVFCPDLIAEKKIKEAIALAQQEKDSCGGVVGVIATGLPVGFGDPVYEKLEANLAKAFLSIPASKGFEVGEGFRAAMMRGSEHNDVFIEKNDHINFNTNHAGGTLGGISTGAPLICSVAFKPPSSIAQKQKTVNLSGKTADFELPPGSRHDPCVAIRAVPVVEAMAALVLADALLMNRLCRI